MAHSFITNRDNLLSDIITGILPKSDAVDILVGYFYFSGYTHLAEKLADKHLRILVGLDIDTRISNRVREWNGNAPVARFAKNISTTW